MTPTTTELVRATAEMRQAQRDYFKVCRDAVRGRTALNRSKAAEARVDLLLAQFHQNEAAQTLRP